MAADDSVFRSSSRRAAKRLVWFGLAFFGSGISAAYAHAYGERYDLPVPLWMNITGGAAVVALSFVITAWFMRPASASKATAPTNLLTTSFGRALSNKWLLLAMRLISVLLFLIAILSGLYGVPDYSRNAAPTIVWVLGWVGLAFVSLLIGNVWLLLNPWLILFEWADAGWRLLTKRPLSLELPHLRRFGVLPGLVTVTAFVWFMLGSGVAGDTRAIGCVLAVYSLITWAGMFLFGPYTWAARGEAFTLLFTALARFSPTALRVSDSAACALAGCPEENGGCVDCPEAFLRAGPDQRQIILRGYGAGLIVPHPLPLSMTILVLMVLALVAFEGFMDTAQWADLMLALGEGKYGEPIQAPIKTTLLFLAATALLSLLFYAVSALMRRLGYGNRPPQRSTLEIMGLFVLSLIPISIAYHVAHYLYWFTTQIQFVIPAASDPLAVGWDLFGGRDFIPDRAAVPLKVIWHTAVIAIVVGHVIAVYVAHRVALDAFGTRRAALLSQIPMVALMVGYTMTSLWMLAQPIMG